MDLQAILATYERRRGRFLDEIERRYAGVSFPCLRCPHAGSLFRQTRLQLVRRSRSSLEETMGGLLLYEAVAQGVIPYEPRLAAGLLEPRLRSLEPGARTMKIRTNRRITLAEPWCEDGVEVKAACWDFQLDGVKSAVIECDSPLWHRYTALRDRIKDAVAKAQGFRMYRLDPEELTAPLAAWIVGFVMGTMP